MVRRDLGADTIRQISRLLKESIRYGLDHRDDALDYALHYARDMDRALADRFVGMYVNDWTLDYGPRGREAVRRLLDEGHKAGVIPSPVGGGVRGISPGRKRERRMQRPLLTLPARTPRIALPNPSGASAAGLRRPRAIS